MKLWENDLLNRIRKIEDENMKFSRKSGKYYFDIPDNAPGLKEVRHDLNQIEKPPVIQRKITHRRLDYNQAAKLLNEGKSIIETAEIIGVHPQTIQNALYKRRIKAPLTQKIRATDMNGKIFYFKSLTQFCFEMGLSYKLFHSIAENSMGLPVKYGNFFGIVERGSWVKLDDKIREQ